MSVAAVMLVKDEADVIGYTVEHLLSQVDEILVAENGSTDGTAEILAELADSGRVTVLADRETGYWQSKKTSLLVRLARRRGHAWAIPVDADEFWYAVDGRTVGDFLSGIAPDVGKVNATLFHHFPTVLDDPDEAHPFRRIRFRLPQHAGMGKVAVRTLPGTIVYAGNHGASLSDPWLGATGGLSLRHYSWRTEDQYVQKIRNGAAAYAATTLPEDTGAHWRMFGGADDEAIREHFNRYFFFDADRAADELIDDPAPGYE